jgi:glycerol uptake facilitator-like aquaporin
MTDASLEPPREAFDVGRRLSAEALGTAWLLATIVGSGIMAERLSLGNDGVALLANSLATGGSLFGLITIFGPLSGAHFNPVVSLAFAIRRELSWRLAGAYVAAQLVGAVVGVCAAHAMFAEPIWQLSTKLRDGPAQAFSECVATFGLIATILGTLRFRPAATPATVSLYIVAAYWFTASTSFANPAVTFARALSNTFAGIAPSSAPLFIAGELLGGLIGTLAVGWLLGRQSTTLPRVTPLG